MLEKEIYEIKPVTACFRPGKWTLVMCFGYLDENEPRRGALVLLVGVSTMFEEQPNYCVVLVACVHFSWSRPP